MSRGIGAAQRRFLVALGDCLAAQPPSTAVKSRYGGHLWHTGRTYADTAITAEGRLCVCLSWVQRTAGLPEEHSGKSNLSRILRKLVDRGLVQVFGAGHSAGRYVLLTDIGRRWLSDWEKDQSLSQ